MIPISKLKQNLDFNRNLNDVIEVMKLAATLQFNQFRLSHEPFVEFINSLESVIGFILQQKTQNIFLKQKQAAQLPAAIILVSSDEGFLGELSAVLVNRVLERRREGDHVFVLGKQGEEYLSELMIPFTLWPPLADKIEFSGITALRDEIFALYAKGEISSVSAAYARFINITAHQIEFESLLPLSAALSSQITENKSPVYKGDFLFEPDLAAAVEGWVKLWLSFRLYQIFGLSKLAELAARIMHLEGSIQELNKVNQNLKLDYFKYLHGLSDKTIREIYASWLVKNT
jgi:ATP synthase F1 gamma subunit